MITLIGNILAAKQQLTATMADSTVFGTVMDFTLMRLFSADKTDVELHAILTLER